MNGLRQLAVVTTVAMVGMTAAMTAQSHHLRMADLVSALPGMSAQASQVHAPVRVALAAQPIRQAPPPTVQPSIAPPPPEATPALRPVPDPDELSAQGDAVAERVRDIVPADLMPYFDVVLYVSKSARGAWAQHLYLFDKTADGDLVFEQAFPVSTGRELAEKYFTSTPTGMFELDPDRFDRVHFSHRWGGAAMPWAMFLDYTIHGHPTGIALHSAEGHAYELGHRASGGCVRLPPEKAEELFKRFEATERGLVPVFDFDDERETTMTDGSVVRDEGGNILLQDGYKVLLIIEDYPGGPAEIAVLS